MNIDVTYDFRKDSNDLDPDRYSKTLKAYHKLLWSKELPNKKLLTLSDNKIIPNYSYYLLYEDTTSNEKFFLSSDIIATTYTNWSSYDDLREIISTISIDELINFNYLAHTVGAFIIFPHNRINNQNTINQERGTNKQIFDRFDLTLECIRLFYKDSEIKTPLQSVLKRYKSFFDLFINFENYCKFFYLDDLTLNNYNEINFFLPFNSFSSYPLPRDKKEYQTFMNNCEDFLISRNTRIKNLQLSSKSISE